MAPMSREWPGFSLSCCNFFINFFFFLPPLFSLLARRWSCSVWSKSLTFNPWLPSLPLFPFPIQQLWCAGPLSRHSAWWTQHSCQGRDPWSRSSRPHTSRHRSSWSRRWWRPPGTKARPPYPDCSRRSPPLGERRRKESYSWCFEQKTTKQAAVWGWPFSR